MTLDSYHESIDNSWNIEYYFELEKMIRQGDVLLYPVSEIPTYAMLEFENKILAYGEKTGHKHKLHGNVQVYDTKNEEELTLLSGLKANVRKFVEVLQTQAIQPTVLVHEDKKGKQADHKSLILKPGKYAIIQEREYDYFKEEIKPVID